MTRKVALVVDKPGWAFHRIARQIKDHSIETLRFEIYAIDRPRSWQGIYDVLSESHDVVHFFWRPATKYLKSNSKSKITTSVYDHLDESIPDLWRPNNKSITSFWVSSKKLQNFYAGQKIRIIPPVLQDGVDFRSRLRTRKVSPTFVFGWVGNSKWGNNDHKGLETIIKPAIEILQAKGYSIELKLADASAYEIPHSQMSEYYAQIDCLLCASKSEGTPNPILEALANHVPWISTDVGIVREIATERQGEFIVPRDLGLFVEAMEKMINSPEKLLSIKDEIDLNRDFWSWPVRALAINRFFERVLEEDA